MRIEKDFGEGRDGVMADISFFFTNFPDHFFEMDLWKVFQSGDGFWMCSFLVSSTLEIGGLDLLGSKEW